MGVALDISGNTVNSVFVDTSAILSGLRSLEFPGERAEVLAIVVDGEQPNAQSESIFMQNKSCSGATHAGK